MDLQIIGKIILVILGVYEVIARIIPSISDWTILGNIIRFLKIVSDWLNNGNKLSERFGKSEKFKSKFKNLKKTS